MATRKAKCDSPFALPLAQPLAGLLVSVFASRSSAGTIITALSLVMGLLGPLVAAVWLRRTPRPVVLDQA